MTNTVPATPPQTNPSNRAPTPPSAVPRAFALWLVAVAAGVVEAGLATAEAIIGPERAGWGLVVQLLVRSLIFVSVAFAAFRMRRGSRTARLALTVLVGGVGLASLLIGPAQWLAAGHGWQDVRLSLWEWAFVACRVVHVAAVVGAVISMHLPSARRWFGRSGAMIESR